MYTARQVTVNLGISDERVAVSDHIAYFWETEEQFADAVRFLEVGFLGTDHGVVFGHADANAKVLSVLSFTGLIMGFLPAKQTCVFGTLNGTQQTCAISRLRLSFGSGFWNTWQRTPDTVVSAKDVWRYVRVII